MTQTPPSELSEAELAHRELARRALTRRRLLYYIQRSYPDYLAGWVHEEICSKLEQFAEQVIRRESPRLMIAMPPRSGKSMLASQFFPAWFLGNHPKQEIISCSYALSLQQGFSRKVRAQLSDPTFQSAFPDCRLSEDSQNIDGWMTSHGGGFKPAGRGGPITGFGAHVLTLDDLVKNAAEASSASIRESAWDWYTTTARTRLAPGGGILAIGTRWNYDDPMGRMEDGQDNEFGDTFEVIRYPAIAVRDEAFRKKGEALHPERFDLKELRQIQNTVGPTTWEALYQQNPTPETGGYFDVSWFREYTEPPELLRTFMAWDLAIGKRERNDWTVGVVAGIDPNEDLYILDVIRARIDSLEIVEAMLDAYIRHTTFLCGVEQGHLSMAIAPMLDAKIKERQLYAFAVMNIPPGRRDKESRARSLQGRMRQGKVYLPRDALWRGDFLAEFAQFPNGKHDDQCDAAAYVALMMPNIPVPVAQITVTYPEWLKNFQTLSNDTTLTHMAA